MGHPSSSREDSPCEPARVDREGPHTHRCPTRSWILCKYCNELDGNLTALQGVLRATHHASASKHSIMDGIGRNISILATEADLDYNKIVDMLEIVPDEVFGMLWRAILDN
jgi:hypothetical protein